MRERVPGARRVPGKVTMKKLMACGLLSLFPLFACLDTPEDVPAPDRESSVEQESSTSVCCIDYFCPDPDYMTTGCKTGAGPTIREAYLECNAACDVQCQPSGLYCQ
jgi:hypothetical protein